jgi:hypothetical protein
VIKCNHGSSFAIRGHSAALRGQSEATRWAPQRPSAGPQRPSEVIVSNRRSSEASQRDVVRHISHATLGTAPPGGEAIDGAGGQGKGRRGRRRRGRTTPHIRHRSRAPRKHPVPHICSHPRRRSPPSVLAAVFHAQNGTTPLRCAAANSSSVAVVQALLAAYPEAAMETDGVRRPSPLAAWMRGPERSSEVIICNQGQSGVIIRNQRAIRGTQSHSVATRWAPQRPSAGPSEAIRGTQWLIRGDQRYSEALRGHQRPLRATQRHSVAFSGTQRHAEGPRHAVFTAPRPA